MAIAEKKKTVVPKLFMESFIVSHANLVNLSSIFTFGYYTTWSYGFEIEYGF